MYLWLIVGLSAGAGALIAIQGPINAELSRVVQHPITAAAISSSITAVGLITITILMRTPMPLADRLFAAPWYILVGGGVIGIYGVFALLAFTPILGATAFIGSLVAGMMIASLFVDHFGFIGMDVHPINLWRLLGVVLLAGGVFLIRKF